MDSQASPTELDYHTAICWAGDDMLGNLTLEFVERVDHLSCEDELIQEFERSLNLLSVKYFALGEVAGIAVDPPIQVGNYPAEWLYEYIGGNYQIIDPVAHMALKTTRPFGWNEVEEAGLVRGRGKDVYHAGVEHGLGQGRSVPIYQANGYLAVASFCDVALDPDPKVISALELMTLYFHSRLAALRARAEGQRIRLSDRERECLHWAAAGKTDWEIGEILTISQETAHRHIENAKRKLGVKTRVQAVITALRQRELSV